MQVSHIKRFSYNLTVSMCNVELKIFPSKLQIKSISSFEFKEETLLVHKRLHLHRLNLMIMEKVIKR